MSWIASSSHRLCFNPRAREGRDTLAGVLELQEMMFQSTRPRRARPGDSNAAELERLVSIHAPAKGATLKHCNYIRRLLCFNPRAREGRDMGMLRALS